MLSLTEVCGSKYRTEAFKTLITYLLTTAIHSYQLTEEVYSIYNMLKSWCSEDEIDLAKNFISTFIKEEFVKEFITLCPKEEPRRIVYSFLKLTISKVYIKEQYELPDYPKDDLPLILSLLHSLLHEIEFLSKSRSGQFFQLLIYLCDLDETIEKYMTKNHFAGVIFEILGANNTKTFQRKLINNYKTQNSNHSSIFPAFKEKLPIISPEDKIRQAKFPLNLIDKLLPSYIAISEIEVQDSLKVLRESQKLTELFKSTGNSKVAKNILAKLLKTACMKKPEAYFNPILKYLCKQLIQANYSDLDSYYTVLLQLLTDQTKVKSIISAVVNAMQTTLEVQPLTIVPSYIGFIVEVLKE